MNPSINLKYRAAAIAILITGAAARLYGLGDTSLWYDEAVYANNSYTNFHDFIENTRTRNSSPIILPYLYWALGDAVRTPFSVRILPALFGIGAIAVALFLPRVGVSRRTALVSGLWLALSPVQIQYSQEVREYSLSVFVSVILIFSFCKALKEYNDKTSQLIFAVTLAAAPLSSYGLVLLAVALLITYSGFELINRVFSIKRIALLSSPFAFSLLASYAVTAKYQIGVAKAGYLAGNYPLDGLAPALKFIVSASASYMSLATGGLIPAIASMLMIFVFLYFIISRYSAGNTEQLVTIALVVLFLLSICAAFFGLYPLGGIRQHLFAAPLIMISTSSAASFLFERAKVRQAHFYAISVTTILFLTVFRIPESYQEVEDIKSPVSEISKAASDQQVFVNPDARPAVDFHYPERSFFRSSSSPRDVKSMSDEVTRLPHCDAYLLFSQIYIDEDDELIDRLKALGYVVISDEQFLGSHVVNPEESFGTRLVKVSSCPR